MPELKLKVLKVGTLTILEAQDQLHCILTLNID